MLCQAFAKICDFGDGQADWPESPEDGSRWTMANVERSMDRQLSRRKQRAKI